MTSKISYVKFIKEDLRQRGSLIAVLSTIMFLFQPLMLIIGINEKKKWISNSSMQYTTKDLHKWISDFMGYNNVSLAICVVFFSILCGVSGYYYLHSRKKLDLIHSLPIRREKLFLIQFISGIFIFLIPFTISFLVSLLGISFQGLLSLKVLTVSFSAFGIHLLFFLYLYTITIFAMIITGKLLIGLVGTICLLTYGSILLSLFRLLAIRFFSTYFTTIRGYFFSSFYIATDGKDGLSSPLLAYISTLNQLTDKKSPWDLIIFSTIITIVFFIINILLYRQRSTESAGQSIVFPKAEPILKIFLSVPLGIGGAFYFNSLANQNYNNIVFFILTILCTLIFAIVIEFIYTMDIKHLFAHKISLFFSIILAFGITITYRFDLFKFNSYLPPKNDIESMSVYLHDFNARFNNPFSSDIQITKKFLDSSAIKNFDSIYQLAKIGSSTFDVNDENSQFVNIKYNLKNGRNVYRNYLVNKDKVLNCSKDILNNQQYKENLFQTNLYSSLHFEYVEITDIYQNVTKLLLSDEEIKHLLEIYQTELLNSTYFDLTNQFPTGFINFVALDNFNTNLRPLYISFTNTYDYLKQLGHVIPTELDAERLENIEVQNHENSQLAIFDTPEELAQILPELTSIPYYFYTTPIEITLTFKNDSYNSKHIFYLKSDRVPDCMRKITN